MRAHFSQLAELFIKVDLFGAAAAAQILGWGAGEKLGETGKAAKSRFLKFLDF